MTSRRTFVQMVAGGIGLAHASRSFASAPSDKIQVGFIGLGGQGTSRLKEFMRQPDVVAAAVCDLDQKHLDAAAAAVEAAQGHKPVQYHDFRKLLERKDLDAVMVATPDHWHALPTIYACQAGKDVFVEKPLAYSIGEGRAMVTAALKNKRITQMWNHVT
jgi:predicted dehydrogenase